MADASEQYKIDIQIENEQKVVELTTQIKAQDAALRSLQKALADCYVEQIGPVPSSGPGSEAGEKTEKESVSSEGES